MTDFRSLDVGCDLDGVLYNFEADLQAYMIEVKGMAPELIPLPSESWNFWQHQWGWDLQQFLNTCHEATDAGFMFTQGHPELGAVEMMQSLKAKGHNLHVITSRNFGTKSPHNTASWLEQHDIPYDSLILTSHKSIFRPDIMIDDFEKNFYSMWDVGVETWLRDQSWNQDVNDEGYRVFSLQEFEDMVDAKAMIRRQGLA